MLSCMSTIRGLHSTDPIPTSHPMINGEKQPIMARGTLPCLAVKDRKLAFVAQGSNLKVSSWPHQGQSSIDISSGEPIRIKDLVLSHSESFLAIVGENSLAVVDLGRLETLKPEYNKILVYPVGPTGTPIISALWHPASSTEAHLVVLTKLNVLVYDLAVSCIDVQFKVEFDVFPQLKGQSVVSIAFGSRDTYNGSITLYLSTNKGQIFAVNPFLYENFPQRITGDMLADYLAESQETLALCDSKIPPASMFNAFRESIQHLRTNTACLEVLYKLIVHGPASKKWSIRASGVLSASLIGPVADLGSECRLINVSDEGVTTLAAVSKCANGALAIFYLSQLRPLIYAFEPVRGLLSEPTKPVFEQPTALKEKYVKPRRGFGFAVVADITENEDALSQKRQEEYRQAVSNYNAQKKVSKFFSGTLNLLTTLSKDLLGIKVNDLSDVCLRYDHSWFMVSAGGSLIASHLQSAVNLIFESSSKFEVEYLKTSITGISLAYLESSGTSALTVLTATEDGTLRSHRIKPCPSMESKPSQVQSDYKVKTSSGDDKESGLAATELSGFLSQKPSLPRLLKFNKNSAKSLQDVHTTSITAVKQIRDLTRFIVTLHSTLAIKLGELNLQRKSLKENSEKDISAYLKNTEERILKCIERQYSLSKKAQVLLEDILNRFESTKESFNLPLSNAERSWFKELNAITGKVSTGDENENSLQLIVDDLAKKVAMLKNSRFPALNDSLDDILLEKTWKRLNYMLKREGEDLDRTKDFLDGLLQRVGNMTLEAQV